MKRAKKIWAGICAALLLTLAVAQPLYLAYADTGDELEQQLQESAERKEELAEQIKEVEADKARALEAKALLDERNILLQQEIDTVQKQIENTEASIAEYEQKEAEQYELFCQQVRQEEERGTVSYWSVLFNATDFADLLSRIDFINEIMDYSQRIIDDLRQTREQLDTSRQELVKQKETLDATQQELEEQITAAAQLVAEYASTQEGLEAMQAEEEKLFKETEQMLKDWYAQNGGTGDIDATSTQEVLKGLIWPSNARYITDKFGWRDAPTAGASTYHEGVDIGAPYYSDVYAAQSGTVIQAGWNGGYGYSVIIAHDFGVATLYGHMNDYYVSVGQTVSRGQVIGECGSTGISTGPHIHYEVRINGEKIDPLPYLPGYIAYW